MNIFWSSADAQYVSQNPSARSVEFPGKSFKRKTRTRKPPANKYTALYGKEGAQVQNPLPYTLFPMRQREDIMFLGKKLFFCELARSLPPFAAQQK